MTDQIIDYNKTFVAEKGYGKYINDKFPIQETGCISVHGHETCKTDSRDNHSITKSLKYEKNNIVYLSLILCDIM